MREQLFNRVLKGLEETLSHVKANVDFHEKIDTPDTIDKKNEYPEDEPMRHKAKKELVTREVEDTNLANRKDKSHYLNEVEVGWRKNKAAESPEDIMEDAIEMGMANVKSLTAHLQALIVMLQTGNNECLAEPWVQEKLTLSRDYIMAVHDYISSEQNDTEEEDDAEEENNYYGQSSQTTFKGKKRSDLKDSDFLFPETKSFPIVSPKDVKDAIRNYGRMSGNMTYEAFIRKLYNFAKKKGSEFVAAIPKATKDKLGIKENK